MNQAAWPVGAVEQRREADSECDSLNCVVQVQLAPLHRQLRVAVPHGWSPLDNTPRLIAGSTPAAAGYATSLSFLSPTTPRKRHHRELGSLESPRSWARARFARRSMDGSATTLNNDARWSRSARPRVRARDLALLASPHPRQLPTGATRTRVIGASRATRDE